MNTAVPSREVLAQRASAFFQQITHGQLLGLELVDYAPRLLVVRMPYRPEIVGNPYTGYIHSGALTVLIDQTSGAAALMSLEGPASLATLDLRVDHLRPARPGAAVYARAECYRIAREVAFVRCVSYEDDPADPVATSMSTFMRTAVRRPAAEEQRA